MAQSRFTEEFVRLSTLLEESTGSDPSKLRAALDNDPGIQVIVLALHDLHVKWNEFRNTSKHKRVVQAHPDFLTSLKGFDEKWHNAYSVTLNWQR